MVRRSQEHLWAELSPTQRMSWLGLLAVHRNITRKLDETLSQEHGLSLAEWDALVRLAPEPAGARMGDLADMVLLSPSGLTRTIDRLERRGLVERRQGPSDGREVRVRVTLKGRDLLATAAPTHNAELRAHFFGAMTAEETARLAAILEKIVRLDPDSARHPHGTLHWNMSRT